MSTKSKFNLQVSILHRELTGLTRNQLHPPADARDDIAQRASGNSNQYNARDLILIAWR